MLAPTQLYVIPNINMINLIEGLIILIASWKVYQFYTGKTHFEESREVQRKEIIKKYGWVFKGATFIGVISGLGLLLAGIISSLA